MSHAGARGVSVRARGWGFRYAGRANPAIRGLDLSIPAGQKVLVTGASGGGKSTLLAALAGVLGDAEDGDRYGELTVGGRARLHPDGTAGLVLQDPEAQAVLPRIGDDVAFGCENLGLERDEIWRRVAESLELVGLDLPWQTPVATLSGGQKQRLALAGVLAMHPGLILLDEPTANIDPAGARRVLAAVDHVAEKTGATLIVVEHRLDLWLPAVDRLVVFDAHGDVLADGTPGEVVAARGPALAAAGVWLPGERMAAGADGARRVVPADAAPLLSTRGLGVAPAARGPVVARPPDLCARAGAALAVTGPNAAGKTTLALTLGGLLPAAEGAVTAHPALAQGLAPDPFRWRSGPLAARIGSVFQQPERQFLAQTARGELLAGLHVVQRAKGRRAAGEAADRLLERLDLAHLAQANPYTLSGGQKRRLSVAAVLVTEPPLLILDEPTFGQDRRTWHDLVAVFREHLAGGRAIVFVTHDERLAAVLADERVAVAPAERGPHAGD